MRRPRKFDPQREAIGLDRELAATPMPHRPDPQAPVDGVTVGVARMSENSPHGGERHPDGDEVLYLVSGRARVVFIDGDHEDIDLRAGDGLVVPRGAWHRVDILEPCEIVYVTPGTDNEYRPLPQGPA